MEVRRVEARKLTFNNTSILVKSIWVPLDTHWVPFLNNIKVENEPMPIFAWSTFRSF